MSYSGTVAADSPRAFWRLIESGTTIGSVYADSSGHGYDVSLLTSGAISHISSPESGQTAPSFPNVAADNSSSNALTTNNTLGLPFNTSPYTLEGWILPNKLNFWMAWIAYGQLNYVNNFIGSDLHNSTSIASRFLESYSPDNGTFFSPSADLFAAWHYIVITDNAAGQVKFYIDNVLSHTSSVAANNGVIYNAASVLSLGDAGFVAGSWPCPAEEIFVGGLSNIAIYDHVLTAARVQAHWLAMTSVVATPITFQVPIID